MVDNVGKGGNRLATMLWYLESPSDGGETYFPCANDTVCIGGDDPEGYPVPWKCGAGIPSTGVKVPPTPGRAALFYSLRPDGARDGFSLHAGCPPEGRGSKWAVNKWIWNQPWSPASRSKPKHVLLDHSNFLRQLNSQGDEKREYWLCVRMRVVLPLSVRAPGIPISITVCILICVRVLVIALCLRIFFSLYQDKNDRGPGGSGQHRSSCCKGPRLEDIDGCVRGSSAKVAREQAPLSSDYSCADSRLGKLHTTITTHPLHPASPCW